MSRATTKEIKPGDVVILLAGPFAGSRTVVLSVFSDARLGVAGLYQSNRCPLVGVPKSRVIRTSTSVDIANFLAGVTLSEADFFGRARGTKLDSHAKILKNFHEFVQKTAPQLVPYLREKFSLNKCFRVPAHRLKF